MKGKTVWFNVRKGYGFIRAKDEAGNELDVFVHYSKIIAEPGEFRLLEEGDDVEFELFLADRGQGKSMKQAKNVRVIRAARDATHL